MNYLQMLTDKINSYKSYSQLVKDRVLKQLQNRTELNELQYKATIKKLGIVMKANKTYLTRFNIAKKQVYRLERHAYAPELNTLHFINNSSVKVPQMTSIDTAIDYVIVRGLNFKKQ